MLINTNTSYEKHMKTLTKMNSQIDASETLKKELDIIKRKETIEEMMEIIQGEINELHDQWDSASKEAMAKGIILY